MTPTTRRVLLGALTLLGLYVGVWAACAPASFHASFPGPFGAWIALEGPYSEHLVRDVGTLYLALAAASAVGAVSRHPGAGVAAAAAWVVFSVPHLGYHLRHLGHLGTTDAVAQVVSLGATLVLALPLLLPTRTTTSEVTP
jgi:hypothetical protein